MNEPTEVNEHWPGSFPPSGGLSDAQQDENRNDEEDDLFKSLVRYAVWQWELAPGTSRRHVQAYVELFSCQTITRLKKIFKCPTMHCESRRGTRTEARVYCMKLESRDGADGGPFEFGEWIGEETSARRERGQGRRDDLNVAREKIIAHTSWANVLNDPTLTSEIAAFGRWAREVYDNRPLILPKLNLKLRPWQLEVLELLQGPVVKRRIIWIWSAESGTGKTTFFDLCSGKFNVLPGGDYDNTLYAYDGQGVIWFDLSRHQTHDHIPYHALEKLSNETVHLSKKYTSCRKLVSSHIVVTANVSPDEHRLPNRCRIFQAPVFAEESEASPTTRAAMLIPGTPDVDIFEIPEEGDEAMRIEEEFEAAQEAFDEFAGRSVNDDE